MFGFFEFELSFSVLAFAVLVLRTRVAPQNNSFMTIFSCIICLQERKCVGKRIKRFHAAEKSFHACLFVLFRRSIMSPRNEPLAWRKACKRQPLRISKRCQSPDVCFAETILACEIALICFLLLHVMRCIGYRMSAFLHLCSEKSWARLPSLCVIFFLDLLC